MNDVTRRQACWVLAAAAAGWLALILDFALGVSYFHGLKGAVANHLAYFTLWTNTLVALALTAGAWQMFRGTSSGFWGKPETATGLATSILIVALVYNIALRQGHVIRGAYRITNEMTHIVMPIAFLTYWWRIVPKTNLSIRRALYWTAYPLMYSVYCLVQGLITGFFPYFFVDANMLGYPVALLNVALLLIVFAAFNVGLTRLGIRRDTRS